LVWIHNQFAHFARQAKNQMQGCAELSRDLSLCLAAGVIAPEIQAGDGRKKARDAAGLCRLLAH
jgi:hypothetical protein